MKQSKTIIFSLIYICVAVVLSPLTWADSGGHLIINREASFDERLSVNLSIDGKEVAQITAGQNYDGHVEPGKHTVTIGVTPNPDDVSPAKTVLDVKDGQTYSFTAVWQGQQLGLAKN